MCNDKRPNGLEVIGDRQFFNCIFGFRVPFFMVRQRQERNMQTKWKTFGRFTQWIAVAFRLRFNFKENTFFASFGPVFFGCASHKVNEASEMKHTTESNRWTHESNSLISSFGSTRGADENSVWLAVAHHRRSMGQCVCIFAPQALSYVARAHAMCPNE